MNNISIIILSYNRLDELQKNVLKLTNNSNFQFENQIIIIDNNSTDGSKEFLIELAITNPDIDIILNGANYGIGAGRNIGFLRSSSKYIISLDNDSAITAEDICKVPQLFELSPKVGILAFRIVHPLTGELQNPHGSKPCFVANHHGAGFALRREVFLQTGGIDELCEYGADELDLSIHAHSFGWLTRYTPEITVYHNSKIWSDGIERGRYKGYIYNNIRLYYKYFPPYMAIRNSIRYFFVYLYSWVCTFGLSDLGAVFNIALNARRDGLKMHHSLPLDTIHYYDSTSLRPEFGNVPLSLKIYSKLSRIPRFF